MPTLARIAVYPFKSLAPLILDSVRVLSSGALENDRRFALRDETGAFINGKRNEGIYQLRSEYDPATRTLQLGTDAANQFRAFHVDQERAALAAWLGDYFERTVRIEENAERGFPDDTNAPGPTLISTATLETVASWYEGMSLDEARLRFRANLEIAGVEPFWEDRLFSRPESEVSFTVGNVAFAGINPCARCAVPSRSPSSGERIPDFQRIFSKRRRDSLPSFAEPSRFDHFYRLAVNTRSMNRAAAGSISVGDELRIAGTAVS